MPISCPPCPVGSRSRWVGSTVRARWIPSGLLCAPSFLRPALPFWPPAGGEPAIGPLGVLRRCARGARRAGQQPSDDDASQLALGTTQEPPPGAPPCTGPHLHVHRAGPNARAPSGRGGPRRPVVSLAPGHRPRRLNYRRNTFNPAATAAGAKLPALDRHIPAMRPRAVAEGMEALQRHHGELAEALSPKPKPRWRRRRTLVGSSGSLAWPGGTS